MQSTAKELRFHTKEILDSVHKGEEVIITFKGKPYAKIVPLKESKKDKDFNEAATVFGDLLSFTFYDPDH